MGAPNRTIKGSPSSMCWLVVIGIFCGTSSCFLKERNLEVSLCIMFSSSFTHLKVGSVNFCSGQLVVTPSSLSLALFFRTQDSSWEDKLLRFFKLADTRLLWAFFLKVLGSMRGVSACFFETRFFCAVEGMPLH